MPGSGASPPARGHTRYLRTFVDLAERGSVHAVAQAHGIQPSSVLYHLRALEDCLGALFVPGAEKGALVPTARALEILPRVRRMLCILDETCAGQALPLARVMGLVRVRLAGPLGLAAGLVVEVVRGAVPVSRLSLSHAGPELPQDGGDLEVVVSLGEARTDGRAGATTRMPGLLVPVFCRAHAGFDVAAAPWLIPEALLGLSGQLDHWIRTVGALGVARLSSLPMEALVELAQARPAVVLLPAPGLESALQRRDFAVLGVAGLFGQPPPLELGIAAIAHDPALRRLAQTVRRQLHRGLAARPPDARDESTGAMRTARVCRPDDEIVQIERAKN
ncbi:LysR family transcriptional regulator [Cupriavidus sp. 30B13]|uniref:LysR family transcriptional regulator n=1 Tax=Cupriavidus sp. 30B13 TaxID=3384241 RepID=UPI003B8EB16F